MTLKPATLEYVLGLGGWWLDPGGAATLCRLVQQTGVHVPTPYPQNNLQPIYDNIKRLPADQAIILGGDSCGCTRIIQIAADIYPRKVAYLFCAQPSSWCQVGGVPIPDNVGEVFVMYGSAITTLGLGNFKPPLRQQPSVPPGHSLYDGVRRLGNNGKTWVRWVYVNRRHPDDNDYQNFQHPVVQDIKRILAP